jgi:hypothetical protein
LPCYRVILKWLHVLPFLKKGLLLPKLLLLNPKVSRLSKIKTGTGIKVL